MNDGSAERVSLNAAGRNAGDAGEAADAVDVTLDAVGGIGEDGLQIFQHRRGYRFSVDALLLADFARASVGRGPFIDLGTGCGVVSLLLAKAAGVNGVAVEIQSPLAALARRNAAQNGLSEAVEVVEADFRQLRGRLLPGSFQCAVSNPPFFPMSEGRVNPDSERAMARHEVAGNVGDVACAARWLLKDGGALCVVFPAARLTDLLDAFQRCKLRPHRLRFVHPKPGEPANLVLAEGLKNSPRTRLEVLPPVVLEGGGWK